MPTSAELADLANWVEDEDRLWSLKKSNLLEAPRIARLDQISKTVALELRVPMTQVTLIDAARQVFISTHGRPDGLRQTPLDESLCQWVGFNNQPLAITAPNHRLMNDKIRATGLQAYLGVPIHDPTGNALGSFCAVTWNKREWKPEDIRLMTFYATTVSAVLLVEGSWHHT